MIICVFPQKSVNAGIGFHSDLASTASPLGANLSVQVHHHPTCTQGVRVGWGGSQPEEQKGAVGGEGGRGRACTQRAGRQGGAGWSQGGGARVNSVDRLSITHVIDR